MDELKEYIIGTLLIPDAVLRVLTDYSANDPRIYEVFPAFDPVLSSTKKAYILYSVVSYGRTGEFVDRAQVGDVLFHFDIYSYNSDTRGAVAVRLNDILDMYGSFLTTSYKVSQVLVVENFEMGVEGESSSDRKYRHHITARLLGVMKRTPIGT